MDPRSASPPGHIEIRLRDVNQLFNSMDPSPFIERDLAREAEEFIVSWAREHSRDVSLHLVLHLETPPPVAEHSLERVTQAIHNFFVYRERLKRLELRELFRRGRASLAIGLVFLTTCLLLVRALDANTDGTFFGVLRESVLIVGWVAMWRPLEIYLYEWWPLLRAIRIDAQLAKVEVEFKVATLKS